MKKMVQTLGLILAAVLLLASAAGTTRAGALHHPVRIKAKLPR